MDGEEAYTNAPDEIVVTPYCSLSLLAEAHQGEALDVILIRPPTDEESWPACSDFSVQFPRIREACKVQVYIKGTVIPGMEMIYTDQYGCRFLQGLTTKPSEDVLTRILDHALPGRNAMQYKLLDNNDQVLAIAEADLYVWDRNNRIVVCDIDGTITKSNARGVLDTIIMESYVYVHEGVCDFFSNLIQDELKILYLTSRPMTYAQTTRRFLAGLRQGTSQLPEGPLFLHSGNLGMVLLSELIKKDIYNFKSDTLVRLVVLPFVGSGRSSSDVLVAGFGNALTDMVAYEMAGIQRQNIYMIDKTSRISCMDKDTETPILPEVEAFAEEEYSMKEERKSESTNGTGLSNRSSTTRSSRSARFRRRESSFQRLIGMSFVGYQDSSLLSAVSKKILDDRVSMDQS